MAVIPRRALTPPLNVASNAEWLLTISGGTVRAKDALGRYGEDLAARYLEDAGMRVLQRNWRCDLGEIDIVADDGGVLVVCEVKTRRTEMFGTPVEQVHPAKVARLRRLCARWLQEQGDRQVYAATRLDVLGVLRPVTGPVRVDHVRAVG